MRRKHRTQATIFRWVTLFLSAATLFLAETAMPQDDMNRRTAYLEQLQRILPKSPSWEEWLQKSGELPPDFANLPSAQGVLQPLTREVNGKRAPISTRAAWEQHREEIKTLLHQWILGSVPPAPGNIEAKVLGERKEINARAREVELRFGPGHKAKLWCELLIPSGPGPFPVFLTQENHRAWALIALQRGYLACVYAGCDARDDTDTFLEAFPGYDWSRLTRRAWAASRCIDYLATLPEADASKIAITGHSRNGKQSLIAAALDPRIAVVISSSSGAGGSLPSRAASEQHFGEGIENITRTFPDWFHPRWRFFTGREDRLPVDLNELVALIAPRACLLSSALNDTTDNAWAMEQTCLSVKPVYDLMGAPDNVRILWRPGGHETWPTMIERYLDWCDVHFGRGNYTFPERLLYPHNWQAWHAKSGVSIDVNAFPPHALDDALLLADGARVTSPEQWKRKREEIRQSIRQMLGEAPPAAANPGGHYGEDPEHIEQMLGRGKSPVKISKQQVVFGGYINADIYLPANPDKQKLPVILWLHPFNPSHGYVAAYHRGEQSFLQMAAQGYAVFCYDQIGCGRRIEEVEGFYDRYPRWSLLGKMVRDAQAALDVIGTLKYADPDRIWVAGYGLGAMVGLHLCALDDRPAGLAAVCGPPPFRLDTGDASGGGIRRWSHDLMILPRLGFFVGEEKRVPYDVPLLLACAAPRPALVVSPQLDREAAVALVTQAVEAAKPVYGLFGASERLEQLSPEDYNRFGPEMQRLVLDWLSRR